MTTEVNAAAIQALVTAAACKLSSAAADVRDDSRTLAGDEAGTTTTERANFAVGALLPLETLAQELLAIVAAARALQK